MAHIILESTTRTVDLLKRINLTDVTKVTIRKLVNDSGGPAEVIFTCSNNDKVVVTDGFGIGYGGSGPTALVRLLLAIGFPKVSCEKILTCHEHELVLSK